LGPEQYQSFVPQRSQSIRNRTLVLGSVSPRYNVGTATDSLLYKCLSLIPIKTMNG